MAVPAIPCIFNQGFSAAKFLFVSKRRRAPENPPHLFEELGGVWGGGTILACTVPLHSLKNGRIEAFMGVFRQQRTLDRLEDRLRSLELKCDDLERAKKGIDLEFSELYDKVRHQMSRMAKRDALAKKNAEDEIDIVPNDSPSDTLDPISRSIMMRRAGQVSPE